LPVVLKAALVVSGSLRSFSRIEARYKVLGEKERENGLYKQDIQRIKLYSILEDRRCEVIFDHGHILRWGPVFDAK
jgi:hypothetical protein